MAEAEAEAKAAINTTGDGQRNRNDLARNVSIAMQCLTGSWLMAVTPTNALIIFQKSALPAYCENGRLKNS